MAKQLFFGTITTPINDISLAWDDKEVLYYLGFGKDFEFAQQRLKKDWGEITLIKSKLPQKIENALQSYFNGNMKAFDNLEVKFKGTEFQNKAWHALQTIPAGQTISYQEEAKRVGNIKAVRAIGGANNKNPIALVVPCHRVIGKDGSMVGFGGGLGIKTWLLAHEAKNC